MYRRMTVTTCDPLPPAFKMEWRCENNDKRRQLISELHAGRQFAPKKHVENVVDVTDIHETCWYTLAVRLIINYIG